MGVRVQRMVHHPDRLPVYVARRVVLAPAFVLKSDDAPEDYEVDHTVVDMPGGRPARVEFGKLDVDP